MLNSFFYKLIKKIQGGRMFNDEVFGNPEFHPKSFKSSKATVIGKVRVAENVIIAPNASIRADEGTPFFIGKGTNIQDGVIMHGLLDKFVTVDEMKYSIYISSHCSLAHRALIHGPSLIGKKTFVGFDAIVHNATIGRNCFIGHRAMVIGVKIGNYRQVPNGLIVDTQEKADKLEKVTDEQKHFNMEVVDYNKKLCKLYKERRKLK